MTLRYGSREYNKALKELGLKVYSRIDPTISQWAPYSYGFAKYIVAPVIENGKKVEWQIYHDNPDPDFEGVKKTMDAFQTKEKAIRYLRREINQMKANDPWYYE